MTDKKFHIEVHRLQILGDDIMYVDVSNCARCGSKHDDLAFRKFLRGPQKDNDNSIEWTHWAMCPVLQEPVLLRIFENG